MSIKLKYQVLENPEFIKALKVLQEEKLPLKDSVTIVRISNKIAEEQKIYQGQKVKLIKEYGKVVKDNKGKDTGQFQVLPEKVQEFIPKFEELLNIEIDLPFEPINLNNGLNISAKDLGMLSSLVLVDGKSIIEEDKISK